jgi:N-methylhydantoinase A
VFARSRPFTSISNSATVANAREREAARRPRSIYLKELGGFAECEVLSRSELSARGSLAGPLVIEDPETTIIVDSGAKAHVDEFGNVAVEL